MSNVLGVETRAIMRGSATRRLAFPVLLSVDGDYDAS